MGQPELVAKISGLPQFDQRIAIRYHLFNLSEQEAREYILHRISISVIDKNREIFADNALELIARASAGIPRTINNICDMCLLAGFGAKKQVIDIEITRDVIRDLEERYSVQRRAQVG
jgi:general secretion pathway protein A